MMIDKVTGRTLSGAAKRGQETTFGAAEAITLALMGGFAAIGGGSLLLMIAII
ncbi:MAG: hypothetical protein AVDCRST_MAG28-3389 [uncultured Rubrobacteraceae bacterium]|uniref:Uncharacterized protein n=1 Tax=uncultured Rubrobacteraceae bacterium TaxID=349277 RepID=A0A6J4RC98_9ACTN|nr:MAG: hypothetical protein AVDCRST_MAG28-3389 [uncultured Rubrobacteraceae bacterium]